VGPLAQAAMVSALTAQAPMASGPTARALMVSGPTAQASMVSQPTVPEQLEQQPAPILEALAFAPVDLPEADLARAQTAAR
jgi:hypothetical protein